MFRELFNAPVVIKHGPAPVQDLRPPGAPPARDQAGSGTTEIQREGAFITVQSLITFPGAVAAVTVIVNVLGWAIPAWRGTPLLFVLVSSLVGLTIYYINESDPLKVAKDRRQKVIALIIALFNTFVILSAAVGADSMVRSGGGSPPAPTVEVNHG